MLDMKDIKAGDYVRCIRDIGDYHIKGKLYKVFKRAGIKLIWDEKTSYPTDLGAFTGFFKKVGCPNSGIIIKGDL